MAPEQYKRQQPCPFTDLEHCRQVLVLQPLDGEEAVAAVEAGWGPVFKFKKEIVLYLLLCVRYVNVDLLDTLEITETTVGKAKSLKKLFCRTCTVHY